MKEYNDLRICILAPFIPSIGGMTTIAEMQSNHLEKEGVAVFRVKTKTKTPFKITAFIKLLRVARQCDIIHAHCSSYWGFLPTIMAVIAGKIYGIRIVITYHGGRAEDFFNRYCFIAKPFLGCVDTIVVPSVFLKNVFENFGFKTKIIPNIIELNKFEYIERRNIKPKIIVTRHLKKIYNIECTIQAFGIVKKYYTDAELKIVGDGDQRESLEKLVKKLKLTNVTFTGAIKNENMQEMYQSSDIFINPTTVDNFPVSIIEAFACGLPVISTNVGGVPYILQDGHNGLLVESGDYKAIAKNVFYLIENQNEALRFTRNARKVVEENYTWDGIRLKLAIIYT